MEAHDCVNGPDTGINSWKADNKKTSNLRKKTQEKISVEAVLFLFKKLIQVFISNFFISELKPFRKVSINTVGSQ